MKEQILIDHIQTYITLSEEEASEIATFFEYHFYTKKETLLFSEKRCDTVFFVMKGCLHLYFYDNLGNKKTTQFAIEEWWLTDFLAFQNQHPSNFNIEAVEKSEILSISFSKYHELLNKFPKMERYFRTIYETAYGAALMRFKYINTYSKEEIFFRFKEKFPEFVQRVPQYVLASFLGLTPEYLSEIKKKQFS